MILRYQRRSRYSHSSHTQTLYDQGATVVKTAQLHHIYLMTRKQRSILITEKVKCVNSRLTTARTLNRAYASKCVVLYDNEYILPYLHDSK